MISEASIFGPLSASDGGRIDCLDMGASTDSEEPSEKGWTTSVDDSSHRVYMWVPILLALPLYV